MKQTLTQFAESLASKFSTLNQWFKNKGIDPSEAFVVFINKDNEVKISMLDGLLHTGHYAVELQNIDKDDILDLTVRDLIEFSEVVDVEVFLDKDDNGEFLYQNPLKAPFV